MNKNLKNIRIDFQLSEPEKLALDRLSSDQAQKTSETLRSLIRQEAQRRGLWPVVMAEEVKA